MYIANRPAGARYQSLETYEPLLAGELQSIVANNTNHWRKALNVYAKVLWQLDWMRLNDEQSVANMSANSWQEYRDLHLLQSHSHEAMLFSPPDFTDAKAPNLKSAHGIARPIVHWVVGKTYAAALPLPALTWIDANFAINLKYHLIVSPYVDYRQLTNERIEQFADIYQQVTR